MKRLFADTFYFIALLNPNDRDHSRAVELSRHIMQIVTTEWVLLELADGLAATPARNRFQATRDALTADTSCEIIPLDMAIHLDGINLYINRPDKEWSLTDCVSFVVMGQLGITDALTGDRHFEQAGFQALLK